MWVHKESGLRIWSCSTGWLRNSWSPRYERRHASLGHPPHDSRDRAKQYLSPIVSVVSGARSARSGQPVNCPSEPLPLDAESRSRSDARDFWAVVNKFGGPSVNPYQPEGYLATLNFPKEAGREPQRRLYRRGIYTFCNALSASDNAELRSRREKNAQLARVISNTPLQALDFAKRSNLCRAAGYLVRGFCGWRQHSTERIQWAFQQATGRRPENDEVQVLIDLHAKSLSHFKADPSGTAGYLKSVIPQFRLMHALRIWLR